MDLLQVLDKSYSNVAVHKRLKTITKLWAFIHTT